MDPARREFLEKVLKSLTVDVVEQLQKAAESLGSSTATEDDQIEALNTIMEYIVDMDTANDFCKIGGLSMLLPLLKSPHEGVRNEAASLIAELAQNNPFCQKELLDANALPQLMELISEPETATKGLHAISCLVRCYEPSLTAFLEIGGLECIIGCLQQCDQDKIVIRALFLLSSLCNDYSAIRDEVIKLRIIDHITRLLRSSTEYDVRTEAALSVLLQLTENSHAISQCQNETNLRQTLDDIIRDCGKKPECFETVEYAQALLEKVFSSKSDSTDR